MAHTFFRNSFQNSKNWNSFVFAWMVFPTPGAFSSVAPIAILVSLYQVGQNGLTQKDIKCKDIVMHPSLLRLSSCTDISCLLFALASTPIHVLQILHITVQLLALSLRMSEVTDSRYGLLGMCEVLLVALEDFWRFTFLLFLLTQAKVATWKMSLTLFSDCSAEHSM